VETRDLLLIFIKIKHGGKTMKCLKSSKTGEIIRVSDEKAFASASVCKFIPKSEWIAQLKKTEPVATVEVVEETISEKQLKKKKSK
jgi:hypothetical protein